MTELQRCGNCCFYRKHWCDHGSCRKALPVVTNPYWPPVVEDDWCGEYRPAVVWNGTGDPPEWYAGEVNLEK